MKKFRKIVLIGASGQLGTDLKKVIPQGLLMQLNYPCFDITKPGDIAKLKVFEPDLVINTAAYNLVDKAEEEKEIAYSINAKAVGDLAKACLDIGATLVHFSTDYVFGSDEKRNIPYTEDDKPGPVSKYGKSKLAGEKEVIDKMKKYFVIRTSGLFGEAGSQGKGGNFIESIIKKAEEGGELKIVDDQILTPTYTLDLAKNVWELIQTENYGLYHITSEGQCSWYEFAREVFKQLKKEVEIIPIKSDELNSSARRPVYSVLENKNLKDLGLNMMRLWQETIEDYLKEKKYI